MNAKCENDMNNSKPMKIILYIFMLTPVQTMSQTLTDESKVVLTSAEGEEVTLYTTDDCDHCYFYLPAALRISVKEGTPEVSFLVWKDEHTSEPIGGILHLLVEWGLEARPEKDFRKILRSTRDSAAVIVGPVMVHPGDNGTVIDGDDKLSEILVTCLKNKPALPSTPGAKMALSFHFTKEEIKDFLFYVNHPEKTKTNLSITYRYPVLTASRQLRDLEVSLRLPFRQILAKLK